MPVRLARFACGVAQRVMQGDFQHLHCVVLAGKVNRKRPLAEGDAPKKRLKRMRREITAEVAAPPPVLVEKRPGLCDTRMMLRWLEIPRDLKQQKRLALHSHASPALGALPTQRSSWRESVTQQGRFLVKPHVALDCAANLLHW